MRFYRLDPEVAGGWGPNTEFTRTPGEPVVVHRFHYQFDGWLGDELLESSPCFIVTQRLAEELQKHRLSGYELKAVEISTSEQFHELYPDRELPVFAWLYITGTAGIDDFGIDREGRLVVSEKAIGVLKTMRLDHCEVADYT
jgi:hypothetical protein